MQSRKPPSTCMLVVLLVLVIVGLIALFSAEYRACMELFNSSWYCIAQMG